MPKPATATKQRESPSNNECFVGLYITPELKAAIIEDGRLNNRRLSAQIRELLERHYARKQKGKNNSHA
jgi:hypothetical protein